MNALKRAGVRIAVDVGTVRVGVAATDPDALVATPVMTLRRDKNKNSDIRMLVKIATDREVHTVFVGLPLSLSGMETASTQMARDYAQDLATAIALAGLQTSVHLVDERLSTVSAAEKMRTSGVESKDQKRSIDQAAAVEILTHCLNMRAAQDEEPGTPVYPQEA